ncbi:MAG: Gfo/Idh/MocA family protein, partial [Erysipelotrichaceae bacterium]
MIKTGILSTASIVPRVIEGIRSCEGFEICALASRDKDKADIFCDKYGILKSYGSYDELIEDEEIDFIYIPLINSLHYVYAKKAIENNKHVLLEKPFTLKAWQTRKLFSLAREHNVFLMESMKTLFMESVIRLKEAVDSGIIGRVRHVRFEKGTIGAFGEGHWMLNKAEGGGAFMGNASYVLALCYFLFGGIDRSAVGKKEENESDCDLLYSFLMNINGISVDTVLSLNVKLKNEMVIYGETGRIEVKDYWRPWTFRVRTDNERI